MYCIQYIKKIVCEYLFVVPTCCTFNKHVHVLALGSVIFDVIWGSEYVLP